MARAPSSTDSIAAQIANKGGSNIVVALNPLDYLAMQLAKVDTSGAYLGVPATLASRVVSVAAVFQGKVLAFAPTSGAAWGDREGVNVQVGLKNDDFIKNAVTLLCESRGVTIVRDPAHVAYGNVTATHTHGSGGEDSCRGVADSARSRRHAA